MAGTPERLTPDQTPSLSSPETSASNFYPNTISTLRNLLAKLYSDKTAKEDLDDPVAHSLWMLEQVETMDNSPKAGRWIGYVFGRLEAEKILSNQQSRDMVRVDVKSGHE